MTERSMAERQRSEAQRPSGAKRSRPGDATERENDVRTVGQFLCRHAPSDVWLAWLRLDTIGPLPDTEEGTDGR